MIGCLLVPDIVAHIEQSKPEAAGKAVILTNLTDSVQAASLEAVQAGIRVGMTKRQAHVLYPTACFLPFDQAPYLELTETIANVLHEFTFKIEVVPGFWKQSKKKPHVPVYPSGAIYYLDLGKISPNAALHLAQEIQTILIKAFDVSCCLGLASGKFPASVAVRFAKPNAPKLVRLGQEGRFLASHPVSLLPLGKEIDRRLHLLGITTLGAFAALPASAVFNQFDKQGRILHQLAKGKDARSVAIRTPKPQEHIHKIFDGAIENRTTLESILEMIGCEIEQRLGEKNLTTQAIQLVLTLDDGKTVKSSRILRDSTANGKLIGRNLLRLLHQLDFSTGVVEVHITVEKLTAPVMQQLDLFGTPCLTKNRISDLLENLTTRFGNESIYHIEAGESDHWLPEHRFIVEPHEVEVA